jgi:hypothetical protein
MTAPISAVDLLKADLSAHPPMMAQYLGVTFSSFSGKAFEAHVLGSVPSWSP